VVIKKGRKSFVFILVLNFYF